MIEYSFGERKCIIDFNKFLSLKYKNEVCYKSLFNEFSELYEFIELNKKEISHILFDGYEYFLENGVLHNLYGPAYIKINDKENPFTPIGAKILWFYIDGKLVFDSPDKRGCKKLQDFENNDIFHYVELTNKKPGKYYKRKEGIDYIKTSINLEERRKNDIRSKKLKKLKKTITNISE